MKMLFLIRQTVSKYQKALCLFEEGSFLVEKLSFN